MIIKVFNLLNFNQKVKSVMILLLIIISMLFEMLSIGLVIPAIQFFVNPETGERMPIAFKTQRSKSGQSGKLNTTMQWSKDIQKCFKGGAKEERMSFKQWIS